MAESTTKSPQKKRGAIPKTPIRRLMGDEGADIVANDAIELVAQKLEEYAIKVTKNAIKSMKDNGRKRLTAIEIRAAL